MMLRLSAGHNGVVVDTALGNIPELWFGPITPLHRAPWYGSADEAEGLAAVERRLAGDFLCMPFGKSDLVSDPLHGFPANARWQPVERHPDSARLRLTVPVMGATVEKELRIAHDAPLLYQTHVIEGGAGEVTLAHHPMVHMAAGGRLAFSPKVSVRTPDKPLEPGANWLPPGVRASDPAALPGGFDLTRYPDQPCEDFVTLVEAKGRTLGWTAVTRAAEGDIVFVLKDPRVLPVTMLWFSNGGRRYAPWSGRHRGVLGIEDGVAAGSAGHKAASGANPIRDEGVPTVLALGGRHVIRHVIGAIPKPAGWSTVARIHRTSGALVLTGDSGGTVEIGFAAGFL
jgi:hypothetical protein